MTCLAYTSSVICYVAACCLLFSKSLKRTIPYPMITFSLLMLGSLSQMNYMLVARNAYYNLKMIEAGVFLPLKMALQAIGVISSGVSVFQEIIEM